MIDEYVHYRPITFVAGPATCGRWGKRYETGSLERFQRMARDEAHTGHVVCKRCLRGCVRSSN